MSKKGCFSLIPVVLASTPKRIANWKTEFTEGVNRIHNNKIKIARNRPVFIPKRQINIFFISYIN